MYRNFSADQMATYVMVALSWIDECEDRLNKTSSCYKLGQTLRDWAGSPTSECMAVLDGMGLAQHRERSGRTHAQWVERLQALRAAAYEERFDDLPDGTRLRGFAPMGLRWEAVKTGKGRLKPDGNCPPAEFSLTHALVNGRWLACQR